MKIKIIVLLIACSLISCRDNNINRTVGYIQERNDKLLKKDSLFIGNPILADTSTVISLGKNSLYGSFENYENILEKNIKLYEHLKKKQKDTLKIDNNLKLVLYKNLNRDKNIRVLLFIQKAGINVDSISFFESIYDKEDPFYPDQRFEKISYLDDSLNLWQIQTMTHQSEEDFSIMKYYKYKIDKSSGKFKVVTTFYDTENKIFNIRF